MKDDHTDRTIPLAPEGWRFSIQHHHPLEAKDGNLFTANLTWGSYGHSRETNGYKNWNGKGKTIAEACSDAVNIMSARQK